MEDAMPSAALGLGAAAGVGLAAAVGGGVVGAGVGTVDVCGSVPLGPLSAGIATGPSLELQNATRALSESTSLLQALASGPYVVLQA